MPMADRPDSGTHGGFRSNTGHTPQSQGRARGLVPMAVEA